VKIDTPAATVAGRPLRGTLTFGAGTPRRLDGRLALDVLDATALFGGLVGWPAATGSAWPADPFAGGLAGGVSGQVDISARSVIFGTLATLGDASARLRFTPAGLSVDDVTGTLAGGRASASLSVSRAGASQTWKASLSIADADARRVLVAGAHTPVGGRANLKLDLDATGRSPQALVGALSGQGLLSLSDITVAGLDPRVFDEPLKLAEQSQPIVEWRLQAAVATALAAARMTIPAAELPLLIANGQVRVTQTTARTPQGSLALQGTVDLSTNRLDGKLVLAGIAPADVVALGRPEAIVTLGGRLDQPTRGVDTGPLAAYLSLIQIDRQTKRLEALEAERRAREDAERKAREAALPPPTAPAPAPPSIGTDITPTIAVPEPAPPAAAPTPARQRPQASRPATPAPAEAAPDLPPPLDIRPAPEPRPQAPRPQPPRAQTQAPRPPQTITPPQPPRGILDQLFGTR
jgi:large subunit ribosomal protein L24